MNLLNQYLVTQMMMKGASVPISISSDIVFALDIGTEAPNGTQNRTVTGLGDVAGVFGLQSSSGQGSGVLQDNIRTSLGAWSPDVGSTNAVVANRVLDATSGTTTENHHGSKVNLLVRLNANNTSIHKAATVSDSITNGVELTYSGDSGLTWNNSLTLIGGADALVDNVVIEENQTVLGTATANIRQEPDIVIAYTTNDDLDGQLTHDGYASFNLTLMKVESGSVTTYAGVQCSMWLDGGVTKSYSQVTTDGVRTIDPTESEVATDGHFTFDFPDVTTIRMTTQARTADAQPMDIGLMCISLGNLSSKVGVMDTPTMTGEQEVNLGLGFTPQLLLTVNTLLESIDTFTTGANASTYGTGVVTRPTDLAAGNGETSATALSKVGVAITNASSLNTNKFCKMYDDSKALSFEAAFTSFSSNGFNANWTTVESTTKKWPYLVIEKS